MTIAVAAKSVEPSIFDSFSGKPAKFFLLSTSSIAKKKLLRQRHKFSIKRRSKRSKILIAARSSFAVAAET